MEQLGDGVYFAEIRQVPGRYVAGTSSGECACVWGGGLAGTRCFPRGRLFGWGIRATTLWSAPAPCGERVRQRELGWVSGANPGTDAWRPSSVVRAWHECAGGLASKPLAAPAPTRPGLD